MNDLVFEYKGKRYPDYLRRGNGMQFIAPTALKFCQGRGLDVGCGKWPLPGAQPVDIGWRADAYHLPEGDNLDFIFSSHCLEHLDDPVRAIEEWRKRLRPGGVLFLYLPHPDMEYWRPENNRKHRHLFWPSDVAAMLATLGFEDILHGERDLAWGFAVVGFRGTGLGSPASA